MQATCRIGMSAFFEELSGEKQRARPFVDQQWLCSRRARRPVRSWTGGKERSCQFIRSLVSTSPPARVPIAFRVAWSDEPEAMLRMKWTEPSAKRKLDPTICILEASSRFRTVGLLLVP